MFKKKKHKEEEGTAESTLQETGEEWLAEPVSVGQLNLDLYETPGEIVVVVPAAGVDPQELEIKILPDGNGGQILKVSGQRSEEKETDEKNYYYKETYWGAFEREVSLPMLVDATKYKRTDEHGIVTLRLPKVVASSEVVLRAKKITEK